MYLQDLWKQILFAASREIPKNHFLVWFANTGILDFENSILRVGTPNPTAQATIHQKFLQILLKCAKEVEPEIQEIIIELDSTLSQEEDVRRIDVTEVVTVEKKSRKHIQPIPLPSPVSSGLATFLNPHYTLDGFVPGKDNNLAHAACSRVAEKPGTAFNPLFIFGGVGLGKTHLLQGIGNAILKNHPDASILYLTAERFLNEYVACVRKSNMIELRKRYRNVDCLIVDDIHFIARKEGTQEEFFHTFNELREANKQIVLSSDCPPRALLDIDERLKSRFASGMVVEVSFPDSETRLAILQRKCQEEKIVLAPEILELIAENVYQSIRELEGLLTQIMAQIKLQNFVPTIKSVGRMIQEHSGSKKVHGLKEEEMTGELKVRKAEEIIELISQHFQISKEELMGASRKKEILIARQLCMYLIYEVLRYSYDSIGSLFAGRNHTTALHAHHKIRELILRDQKIASDCLVLKREMGL